jgi:hypothetical protein
MKESFEMFWMLTLKRETNSNSCWSNPSPACMAIAVDAHSSICFLSHPDNTMFPYMFDGQTPFFWRTNPQIVEESPFF